MRDFNSTSVELTESELVAASRLVGRTVSSALELRNFIEQRERARLAHYFADFVPHEMERGYCGCHHCTELLMANNAIPAIINRVVWKAILRETEEEGWPNYPFGLNNFERYGYREYRKLLNDARAQATALGQRAILERLRELQEVDFGAKAEAFVAYARALRILDECKHIRYQRRQQRAA